jgi:hypothetical protein
MILLALLVLSIAGILLVIALCRASAHGQEVGAMHLAELRRRQRRL